ncbi:MAG: PIG-L family deacetylase [Myxococcota bacterium]
MDAPIDARPEHVDTSWILAPSGRPTFIFAHQDDETVLSGIIHRIIGNNERGTFIWWTNGDGLAPEAKMAPEKYAEIRVAESTEALKRLGGGPERKIDLWSSEIENYRRFTEVAKSRASREAALSYFDREADRVEAAIRQSDPDRVFLLAWQGGHPEHDLTHLMTARAVRRLRNETGRPIPIIQIPAYEYTIACALRFKPWYHGDVRSITLTPEELEQKRNVFDAYPSQRELFRKFRSVIEVFGKVGMVTGKSFTAEGYISKEQFGVVDPRLDYRRSTHRLEMLNYMGDDFLGVPIRFDTMIRPLAEAILG